MSRKPPQVREPWVLNPEGDGYDIRLDTEAWFTWLERPTTTRFAYGLFDSAQGYVVGVMTVRKDHRQRGGSYWSVFRRNGGRLHRVYVGGSSKVTAARLSSIAQELLQEWIEHPPSA